MNFSIIIPARHGSSRLPGKMLLPLQGKPMIQWVYERASAAQAKRVVIATDHPDIQKTCLQFGAEVFMTSSDCQTGTQRLAEVVQNQLDIPDDELIVNVQGDEPFIEPRMIQKVVDTLASASNAMVATLVTAIKHQQEFENPNVVKVVFDKQQYALYFSRSPIPYVKQWQDKQVEQLYRHIGLYAYRPQFLKHYSICSSPFIEQTESLEQLKFLYEGHKIKVAVVAEATPKGIDTHADWVAAEMFLREQALIPTVMNE